MSCSWTNLWITKEVEWTVSFNFISCSVHISKLISCYQPTRSLRFLLSVITSRLPTALLNHHMGIDLFSSDSKIHIYQNLEPCCSKTLLLCEYINLKVPGKHYNITGHVVVEISAFHSEQVQRGFTEAPSSKMWRNWQVNWGFLYTGNYLLILWYRKLSCDITCRVIVYKESTEILQKINCFCCCCCCFLSLFKCY